MKIGRHAPLVAGALLVLRIAACGSGKATNPGVGGSSARGGAIGTGRGGDGGSMGGRGGDGGSVNGRGGDGGSVSGRGGDGGSVGGRGGDGGSVGGRGGQGTGARGGAGGDAASSATCVSGDISYVANGTTQTHACPYHDCWIDVATGSAACGVSSGAGMVPFRTCRSAADCAGVTYCNAWGDRTENLLGSAVCMDSVCDWASMTSRGCVGSSQYCYLGSCMTVFPGTSGAFPWAGTAGSTGAGTTGAGGATSGGFPWDAATGS